MSEDTGSEITVTPMTKVKRYFNPHDYLVQVQLSSHNFSLALDKGQCIEVGGVPCNDPVLDRCIGPHGLAREMSQTPVPIVFLPLARTRATNSPTGFVGAPGHVDEKSLPAALLQQQREVAKRMPVPTPPPGNTTSVVAMTHAEAVARGYIRPTRVVNEGIPDTPGHNPTGHALPTLQIPVDVPNPRPPQPPQNAVTKTLPAPPIQELTEDLEDVPLSVVDQAEAALLGKRFGITASTVPAPVIEAKPEPIPNPPQQRVKPIAVPIMPKPTLEMEPEPVAVPAITASAPVAVDAEPAKFICQVDGRPFMHRASLERYVKGKYPDRVDEIMAPYPKGRK